jgi:hypothetical protein
MTKKEIVKVLRSLDRTAIYRACKLHTGSCSKGEVYRFIETYAPSNKVRKLASSLIFDCPPKWAKGNYKGVTCYREMHPTLDAFRFARWIAANTKGTNYFKVLVEGNKNIYWASQKCGHSDYNKSIAMPNTPHNREVMRVINAYLTK